MWQLVRNANFQSPDPNLQVLKSVSLKIILFIYLFGHPGSSLRRGFSSGCGEQGLLFGCDAQASHCGGFSCCRAQA